MLENRPRYLILANILLDEIREGRIAVGDLLPSEQELAVRHALSRHTVREALRRLQSLGIVNPRQGRGTEIIASAPNDTGYSFAASSINEIFGNDKTTRYKVKAVGSIRADTKLAAEIGCRKGQEFLFVEGMRWTVEPKKSPPTFASRVYVSGPYMAIRDHITPKPTIIEAIEKRFGIRVAEIEHRIEASLITTEAAEILKVAIGTPALKTRRRYLDASGDLIAVGFTLSKAGKASVVMRLKRQT